MRLQDFRIADAQIHGIGPTTKHCLIVNGYETAADFTGGGVERIFRGRYHYDIPYLTDANGNDWRIPKLGEARLEALLSWRSAVLDYLKTDHEQVENAAAEETADLQSRWETLTSWMESLEGPRSFEDAAEAKKFVRSAKDQMKELRAIRSGYRRVPRMLKDQFPGWRRHPAASIHMRMLEESTANVLQVMQRVEDQFKIVLDDLVGQLAALGVR